METNNKVVIQHADMCAWVNEMFMAVGMNREDAELSSENLVTASDLRGVYSHGVMRVPTYIKRIQEGVTSPDARPDIVREMGATALMDGNNAMGQVVGVHAMKLAIEKARQFGVGYVSVRGSNHYGACAHFAMMALPEDMIGITGTIGSTLIMAPWGGIEPLLGNNPVGTAIPALNKDPIVLDMAQSVVARGKIVMAMKTNQPIPDTWGFDREGKPTTDATEAYWGTVRPMGDYKGYGLTFVTALMSATLSGSNFGREVTDLFEEFSTPQNVGHYMQAINISAFMNPNEFKTKVDEAIDLMQNSKKAPGTERIYVPGEIEAIKARQQMKEGITYPVEIVKELEGLSEALGVKSRYKANS